MGAGAFGAGFCVFCASPSREGVGLALGCSGAAGAGDALGGASLGSGPLGSAEGLGWGSGVCESPGWRFAAGASAPSVPVAL